MGVSWWRNVFGLVGGSGWFLRVSCLLRCGVLIAGDASGPHTHAWHQSHQGGLDPALWARRMSAEACRPCHIHG